MRESLWISRIRPSRRSSSTSRLQAGRLLGGVEARANEPRLLTLALCGLLLFAVVGAAFATLGPVAVVPVGAGALLGVRTGLRERGRRNAVPETRDPLHVRRPRPGAAMGSMLRVGKREVKR